MAKIYIDQGHNPENPNAGAEGNGYREQDLVYEIGIRTAEILRRNGQHRLGMEETSSVCGCNGSRGRHRRIQAAKRQNHLLYLPGSYLFAADERLEGLEVPLNL